MKIKLWISAFLIFISVQLQAQQQNILSGKFTADELKNKLASKVFIVVFGGGARRAEGV